MIGAFLGIWYGVIRMVYFGEQLNSRGSRCYDRYDNDTFITYVIIKKCTIMFPFVAIETFLCLGRSLTFQAEKFYLEIAILLSSFLDCSYLYLEFWLCVWWVQRLLLSISIIKTGIIHQNILRNVIMINKILRISLENLAWESRGPDQLIWNKVGSCGLRMVHDCSMDPSSWS